MVINSFLVEFLYNAAHIQRWNDHIRPNGFTELDKQSHKMIIAYLLGKAEEHKNVNVNWTILIEGGIFEFLHRVLLTDIKPPIFRKIMQVKGKEVNEWVVKQFAKKIEKKVLDKFKKYFLEPQSYLLETKILKAAHYLATRWEFNIIYHLNPNIFDINEIRVSLENEFKDYYDLAGIQNLVMFQNFIDLVGQLRFQQRWAQTPRVPETSVMGHTLIVAILTYFSTISLNVEPCDKRIYNNFFGGLFHDLPEVLTRDIVRPVKTSTEDLEELIKEIENTEVNEKLLPLLPDSWHDEIKYFIEDEFTNKIMLNNLIKSDISIDEININYNKDNFSPIDGKLIQICDDLAAYLEACLSIFHGITSHHLKRAKDAYYKNYKNKIIAGINFGELIQYFYDL